MRRALVVAGLLLGGCTPLLMGNDGSPVGDGGATGGDGSATPTPDGGGAHDGGNGGSDGGGGLGPCKGCGCPLLVAVSNANAQPTPGRVILLPLDQGATPTVCPTQLRAGGSFPSHIGALAFLPPGTVAVGGDDSRVNFVTLGDVGAGTFVPPVGETAPIDDLARVVDGAGKQLLAVAYDFGGSPADINDLQDLYVVDPATGQRTAHWVFNKDIAALPNGAAASPLDPTRLFLYSEFDWAAADVDLPWSGATHPQSVVAAISGGVSPHFNTGRLPSGHPRAAWAVDDVNRRTGGVVLGIDPGGGWQERGPIACGAAWCEDAVPDPTDESRALALCDDPAHNDQYPPVRRVVRIDTQGHCDVMLDAAAIGPLEFFSRLAVGASP